MTRPSGAPIWVAVVFAVLGLSPADDVTGADLQPLQIAVAANFKICLEEICEAYTENGGSPTVLIVGSTGRHFAQINNGAPFDLFFAADQKRPRLLEDAGLAVEHTRFTYATGRLVLWSSVGHIRPGEDAAAVLKAADFRHLAVANPDLAPYGRAARQTLESLGLTAKLADRLVTGQSVGQAWQFVASGAAEWGLVAASQAVARGNRTAVLPIPSEYHDPIIQQVVLLERARDNAAAMDFLSFVQSPAARAIIQANGYGLAEALTP